MTSLRVPPTFMPGHALVPAGDDLLAPEAERERLVAVVAAVELGPVRQGAGVVDLDRFARNGLRPGAGHGIFVLQAGIRGDQGMLRGVGTIFQNRNARAL